MGRKHGTLGIVHALFADVSLSVQRAPIFPVWGDQFPQTGLALMGFSRYCPSSLDLTNFVVRRCRGGAVRRPGQAWPRHRSGNLEILEPGSLKHWDPKNKNLKNIKVQIRSAQNVGKVWISRERILLAPFGAISWHLFHGPEKCNKIFNFANSS